MTALEIARRMAELGEAQDAAWAYTLALNGGTLTDSEEMEAAASVLQLGGDYRVSYSAFLDLYNRGCFTRDILDILTQAFYQPNVKLQKKRYERNCRLLSKYPYCFRRDFPSFRELPIQFYPYDDHTYLPFDPKKGVFGGLSDVVRPVVTRNYFRNLEKPVLAEEVYSQYELEYLRDNVRRSEDIGRENHLYLHYPDWGTFCAWLQVLNVRPLLEEKKVVFLIGDEIARYPIDFKARFGVDYSQYPVRPIGVRDVKRLIWATQLSAHNGVDFFNEIFDYHPNLITEYGMMYFEAERAVADARKGLAEAKTPEEAEKRFPDWGARYVLEELYQMGYPTDAELFTAICLGMELCAGGLDHESRIAPALYFQPHFFKRTCEVREAGDGTAVLSSPEEETLRTSPLMDFPYVKTFVPLRRFTTSYAAGIRYSWEQGEKALRMKGIQDEHVMSDMFSAALRNRGYLVNPEQRLYADAAAVRFEDAKLSPRETFAALAEFLDIPVTPSMDYCSEGGRKNPTWKDGFTTLPVFRTYDKFAGTSERKLLEYFLRDAYAAYGYDFRYYDGSPLREEDLERLLEEPFPLDTYIFETWRKALAKAPVVPAAEGGALPSPEEAEAVRRAEAEKQVRKAREERLAAVRLFAANPRLTGADGAPLRPLPLIAPKDAAGPRAD